MDKMLPVLLFMLYILKHGLIFHASGSIIPAGEDEGRRIHPPIEIENHQHESGLSFTDLTAYRNDPKYEEIMSIIHDQNAGSISTSNDKKDYVQGLEPGNGRIRRASAIKLLNNLFVHKSDNPMKAERNLPASALQQSQTVNNEELPELVSKLTESIVALNDNLKDLQHKSSSSHGYVMIGIPLVGDESTSQSIIEKKYLRNKRDTDFRSVETTGDNFTVTENEIKAISTTEANDTAKANNSDSDYNNNIIDTTDVTNFLTNNVNDTNETVNVKEVVTPKTGSSFKRHVELRNDSIINKITEPNAISNTENDTALVNATQRLNTAEINDNSTARNDSNVRRASSYDEYQANNLDFSPNMQKEDLIASVEQAYENIKRKLKPIKQLKASLGTDKKYKIGYIIANIETLELTLKKMNKRLTNNIRVWNAKRINHVLNKMKLSDDLVSNIMQYLRQYADSKLY